MRRFLVSAIALALAGNCVTAMAAAPTSIATVNTPAAESTTTTQLPRNVRPTHYDVAITPHAQSLSFDGQVTITLEVLEPTDEHHPATRST